MSAHELNQIRVIADLALAATSDQRLVSQRQYIDVLLDMRGVAVTSVVRETIEERLSEIRFVTMVDSADIRADLAAVVAISELEDELEMAWAEAAVTCDCHACVMAIEMHEARSVSPC